MNDMNTETQDNRPKAEYVAHYLHWVKGNPLWHIMPVNDGETLCGIKMATRYGKTAAPGRLCATCKQRALA